MKEYHLKPLKAGAVNYKDVNADLGDLADYIQLAYQLQIMGINADGTPMQALSHINWCLEQNSRLFFLE